jgi:hypothetical protein
MTNDDEFIADFRRRNVKAMRRLALRMLIVLLYIAVSSALYGYAVSDGWFARHGIDEGLYVYIMPLPVLIWVMLGPRKRETLPRLEALPESILRKQIDHYQQRWCSIVLVLLFLLIATTLGFGAIALHPAAMTDFGVVAGAVFFLEVFLCAFATVFYPGLKVFDDERLIALRGRAAKAGFIILLLALGAAFPAILRHPEWTTLALIGVLFAGGAAPALYYVIADWRAGR